ncbi:MAG TPA: DUF2520 domain-containing protein, partial [Bryobacteraceae bacterium]|nr:DUF2520 domain-containing protein [Bryobacteraceae bacterium]
GSLATFLASALCKSGYFVTEIISRNSTPSRRHARALACRVGGRAVTEQTAELDADLVWLCVPDRSIRDVASSLAARGKGKVRFAFHSSGALLSRELYSLRRSGAAIASVHPLMTFVPRSHPSLVGVPFALEGDGTATRLARQIVRDLGGESFALPAARKAAYHTWATLTSPLWLAFLVTLEEAARVAGLTRAKARRMSLPIIRQTLENYARLGPESSFSGPIIRGDVATAAKHLAVLKKHPAVRSVYVALALAALDRLPAKNRKQLRRLLAD